MSHNILGDLTAADRALGRIEARSRAAVGTPFPRRWWENRIPRAAP